MAHTAVAPRHPANASDITAVSSATWIDCSAAVEEYISKSDWRINANANVGYSHAGLVNSLAGKVIANYWLDEIYAPEEGRWDLA